VTSYPDQVRRQERAEARKRRRRRRRFSSGPPVGVRMRDLFRVFVDRYGDGPLPDDDAGRDDLKLAFQCISNTQDPGPRMLSIARVWAPWYPAEQLAALIDNLIANPRSFRADTIARRLGLLYADRTRLGITTIGSIDVLKEQRDAMRNEQKRLAKEQKRRAAGVPTIAEARAARKPKEPWKAEGISRATWFRRQRAA
jgi:hypothetical protein